jgi:hypothetical protein
MKKLLIELLFEYVDNITYFVPLLNKKSDGIKGFTILYNDGYLNDEQTISYRFHEGSNISFESKDVKMYFDTLNKRCDGFNSYNLSYFIENNDLIKQKYSIFISEGLTQNRNIISELLEGLVIDGFLEKKSSWEEHIFYYFKDINPIYFISISFTEEEEWAWLESKMKQYEI